jgi:membrane protein YdbS with pleckstrin-like domain
MKVEKNLLQLWQQQQAGIPNQESIIKAAAGLKNKRLRKLIITNVLLLLTGAFIVFIWIRFEQEYWTTTAGIILALLAMASYLMAYNRSFSLLKAESKSTKEFLDQMINIREKQHFMQTTMLNLYFFLLSTGLALYMFEYTLKMTPLWRIVAYSLTALWLLVNWFYFRPRQIRKDNEKMETIIERLKSIAVQLGEDT